MSVRSRFILRYGVIGYGGGLFLIFNVLHIARLHAHGASINGLALWLLVTGAVSIGFGYGFGALAWRSFQRRRS